MLHLRCCHVGGKCILVMSENPISGKCPQPTPACVFFFFFFLRGFFGLSMCSIGSRCKLRQAVDRKHPQTCKKWLQSPKIIQNYEKVLFTSESFQGPQRGYLLTNGTRLYWWPRLHLYDRSAENPNRNIHWMKRLVDRVCKVEHVIAICTKLTPLPTPSKNPLPYNAL